MEKPPNPTIHATDNVIPFIKKESPVTGEREVVVSEEYVDVLGCRFCDSQSFILLVESTRRIACEECGSLSDIRWTTRKKDWEKFRITKDPK